MEGLGLVGDFISGGAMYILPFLFVLTIVVFVHELGHFLMGRFFNTKIDTFSIGFGREMFGFNDRYGTRWKFSWVPLGGYVKFWGDETAASTPDIDALESVKNDPERSRCFHFKPLHQRALIVAAGPIANFIFATFVFAALFSIYGESRIGTRIGEVLAGTPAAAAGILPGDRITAIDGDPITEFDEIRAAVMASGGDPLSLVVDRGGAPVTLEIVPTYEEMGGPVGGENKVWRIGLRPSGDDGNRTLIHHDPASALYRGAKANVDIISQSLAFIGRLIVGREDASHLSGPVGIARTSGEVAANLGLLSLIQLMAVLSVTVGMFNLFPIPMLDGGHLLYYAFEAVRGRPLGERAQEFGFRIGLVLVGSLMVFATFNDLAKLL